MSRSLYYNNNLITEQDGEVYFIPDPLNPGDIKDNSQVKFKPGPSITNIVWTKAITIVVPNGSNNVDIGALINANNPNNAVNITIKVEAGSTVGRLNFYTNIDPSYYVELYNYGSIQGSIGTYGVNGGPAIELRRPVKVLNHGFIMGGGGHGGRGANAGAVAPGKITDFSASDTEIHKVTFYFSDTTGYPTPRYDVYEGSTRRVYDATDGSSWSTTSNVNRNFHVKAINSAGTVNSYTDYGRPYVAPGPMTDEEEPNFSASDTLVGKVKVSFTGTTGYPSPTYNLYENGINVKTGVWNGYERSVSAGTRSYYVEATNAAGTSDSNSDNGTSKAPSGSSTFTSSGTWTCPTGVTSVSLKMIAGGGGGACRFATMAAGQSAYVGGGYRGNVKSKAFVTVTPGTSYTITVGSGGAGAAQINTGKSNGSSGGSSSALGYTVTGGAGGNYSTGNYKGNGGSYISPVGTKYDGVRIYVYYEGDYHVPEFTQIAYGGDAGFGNGGKGLISSADLLHGYGGGYGAGGGGVITGDNTGDNWGGNGGNGYVYINW